MQKASQGGRELPALQLLARGQPRSGLVLSLLRGSLLLCFASGVAVCERSELCGDSHAGILSLTSVAVSMFPA